MEAYYKGRAEEYEEIYQRDDPIRQEEQRGIATALQNALQGRRILEIACGTGYWTQFLSCTAQQIIATDIVDEVLGIAKGKQYECAVSFHRGDAYNLSFEDDSFGGGLANSWLSHIPKEKIDSFLKGFHQVLQVGSRVFMADNVYVPGVGGELVAVDGDDNTYKLRKLKDGSEHLVLKNYYSVEELLEIFGRYVAGLGRNDLFYGKRFWYVTYQLG